MGQVDSTTVDSVVYGFANVSHYNGWNIAFSGILIVFGGLVLIALTIWLFNRISMWADNRDQAKTDLATAPQAVSVVSAEAIPAEHLVAISTAVELYQRLYFSQLETNITFEHGDVQSNWKTGSRYGQRKSLR